MKKGDKVTVEFEGIMASDGPTMSDQFGVQIRKPDGLYETFWVPTYTVRVKEGQ